MLLPRLPALWSTPTQQEGKREVKVTKIIFTTWMPGPLSQVKRERCRERRTWIVLIVSTQTPNWLFFFRRRDLSHSGLRRQPCTINIYSSAHALIFPGREREQWGNTGRKIRRKNIINNSNVPNYWTINKILISINCFHIVAIFTSFLLPCFVDFFFCASWVMMEMLNFIVKLPR